MLGAMSHLALTLSDLKASEEQFYTPVLEFLGYSKVEDEEGMTLWRLASVFAAVNLWQASPELKDRQPGA